MIAIDLPRDYRDLDSTPAVVEVVLPTAMAGAYFNPPVAILRPASFAADLVAAARRGKPLERSELFYQAGTEALSRTGEDSGWAHDLARELAWFND